MSEPVVSFVVETNVGGIPITVCGCGALLMQSMAQEHIDSCLVMLRFNYESGDNDG